MRSVHLKIGFDLCGGICALAWAALVWLPGRQLHGPFDPAIFLACIGVAWLGCVGAYLCAQQTATINFQRIFLWAVVFRAIAWFGAPLYDDACYRNLWEARQFAEEGSPYIHTPAENFGHETVPAKFERILDRVENPQLYASAQPLSQMLFLAGYIMAPGETWPIKLLLGLADFVSIFVLMQLVSPRQSLLYGWCPLLIFETYFHLHVELLAIALLLLGLLHLSRRQHTPATVVSSLSIAVHPLSLIPSLWIASKSRVTEWFISLLVLGSLYGYFLHHDGWNVFSGGWEAATHSEFNSFAFGLAWAYLPPVAAYAACAACFLVFLGFWINHSQVHPRETPRFDWFFLALFLCLPTVYPSYLLWVLPWAVLRPRAWTFTALAVVALSYCYGQNLPPSNLPPYGHPDWVRPTEFGAVAVVALLEWGQNWRVSIQQKS